MSTKRKTDTETAHTQIYSTAAARRTSSAQVKQLVYFGVLVLSGAVFFLVAHQLLTVEQWRWYWKLVILYFIPPLGKESIIPAGLGITSSLGVGVSLPAFLWGLTIWVCDVLVCIGILTNWWILEFFINHVPAFPFVGVRRTKPRLYRKQVSLRLWYEGLHRRTQAVAAKKYGPILPLALLIFMFVPFQGTGAMSTTIIGTGVGFRYRETFLVVALGSFISTLFLILVATGLLTILT